MNKNFTMLNFCTEYSSEGNTRKRMQKDACFSTVFHSERNGINQSNKYKLKIYKIGDWLNKKKQNNACLVDRKGIVHHLKILQNLFKFSYRVKEHNDYFIVTLKLDGDLIYHKYMLTWVRYLYEYPFNVFLLDANKLKGTPKFKFESIINLFNLVGASSGIYQHGTGIHAIGETAAFKELLTVKEIQSRLEYLCGGHSQINDIFDVLEEPDELCDFNSLDEYTEGLKCLEYWESDEYFKERLPLYQENYKILKSKKKK